MSSDSAHDWGAYQLLTGPGPAAIAVLRACGPLAERFVRQHVRTRAESDPGTWAVGRVFRGSLLDESGSAIDDVLLSVHSLAPVWDVRLHLHGSPGLVGYCIQMLEARGLSELSEPVSMLWHSENTIEAEAHALLPRMLTLRGVQWLVQQSRLLSETLRKLSTTTEIGVVRQQCREIVARRRVYEWFARPLRVALVGPPNAGKSTLANALSDQHASLVSPTPGTTRDWVEIPGEIDGFPLLWLDTAGLRSGGDELEAEGVRRTRQLMEAADAVVVVLDATASAAPSRAAFAREQADLRPACVALNKTDLAGPAKDVRAGLPERWGQVAVSISAAEETGLDSLTTGLLAGVGYDAGELSLPAAFTGRQIEALEAAVEADHQRFSAHLLRCLGEPGAR